MEHSSASVRKCVAAQAGWVWSPTSRKHSRTGTGRCRLASLAGREGEEKAGALSSLQWHRELNSNVLPSLVMAKN